WRTVRPQWVAYLVLSVAAGASSLNGDVQFSGSGTVEFWRHNQLLGWAFLAFGRGALSVAGVDARCPSRFGRERQGRRAPQAVIHAGCEGSTTNITPPSNVIDGGEDGLNIIGGAASFRAVSTPEVLANHSHAHLLVGLGSGA